MSKNMKKSPSRAATRSGANKLNNGAHIRSSLAKLGSASRVDYNVLPEPLQVVLAKIPQGEANAIHMAELAAAVGCNERALRKRIAALRAAGVPVLSGNSGYWLPTADADELRHFVRLKQRQLASNRSAVRPVSRLLSEIEPDIITGQFMLGGVKRE